ncbi:tetratricopeptide repeat protein [Myxococcota bacterium]|nr:tetratricopeptide repeat protein [Myxococcota bacterium]
MSNRWIKAGLLVASVGCVGWAHARFPVSIDAERGPGFVPNPDHVRALAVGFDAILADYQWLRAVQVVGGSATVDRERARHLGQLVDVVTTLNPEVDHPYRFAAIWLTHDADQVREGIRLLRRATRHHPDEWRNFFYLGFAQFFYLGEYELAAESLERAMQREGAPPYLARLVARLKAQTGDIDVAEVFLREMLRGTVDPENRARLQVALDEIELEYKARLLDRARAAYRMASGRDIRSVEDLIRPPHRMLVKLPSAEPDAIPAAHARGSTWIVDPASDRIVSTYLGRRYEVHLSPSDRDRLESWRQARSDDGAAARDSENGVEIGASTQANGGRGR